VVTIAGRVVGLGPFEAHQRRRGAAAAVELTSVAATGERRGGVPGVLDRVRGHAERALARGLPPDEAALLRGMVLGQDEAIREPVLEEFRRSGLAHLVAASGSNVMLLAVLAIGSPRCSARRCGSAWARRSSSSSSTSHRRRGPSIQRAGVMGVAGLVAALAGRPAARWYAVGLAAAVTSA
jgi:competence protein ComEC